MDPGELKTIKKQVGKETENNMFINLSSMDQQDYYQ